MTKDQYYAMQEQLGKEVDPARVPKDLSDLPLSFQTYIAVFSYLPDRYEGMSATYLGKDLSPLGTLLDIFEVTDRVLALQVISRLDKIRSDTLAQKQRANKSKKGKK